jgi:hypothetical protein
MTPWGREYPLAVDGRTIVARRPGRAAGAGYRRPLARRDPKLPDATVRFRARKELIISKALQVDSRYSASNRRCAAGCVGLNNQGIHICWRHRLR